MLSIIAPCAAATGRGLRPTAWLTGGACGHAVSRLDNGKCWSRADEIPSAARRVAPKSVSRVPSSTIRRPEHGPRWEFDDLRMRQTATKLDNRPVTSLRHGASDCDCDPGLRHRILSPIAQSVINDFRTQSFVSMRKEPLSHYWAGPQSRSRGASSRIPTPAEAPPRVFR